MGNEAFELKLGAGALTRILVLGLLASSLLLFVLPRDIAQAAPTKTDVTFVFDTSGSMGPVLDEAKSEIESVMIQLQDSLPDVEFGLAEVRDYPAGEYGASTDEPWRLDVPVTTDVSEVNDAVSTLFAGGGGDSPEAYGRALWETDTNPRVGWRPGARHLIVLVADQVPHDNDVNEGIPEEFWAEPSPWETGEELPGGWGIPGTQLGGLETLDFQSILRSLAADEKPLETVDYKDTGVDYIHYWEYWAGLAGGSAIEASERGNELATELVQLVERSAVPCATSASAAPTSLAGFGVAPAIVTPRFLQPGSPIVLTPNGGAGFCKGQAPSLGGSIVTSFDTATSSELAFHTPPAAASGLALTSRAGVPGPQQAYAVDNFRYPWGFQIENHAGDGGASDYDEHISVGSRDLSSVFTDAGPPGSVSYDYAKSEAEAILRGGLCYGFSLLSRSLYDDAHGGHDALTFATSSGLTLGAGSSAYSLTESTGGSHALTHALLRAAISQLSAEERQDWNPITSTAAAEAELNSAFQHARPAILVIKFNGEGHALLAFNYQKTASGIAIAVADPNVPWRSGRPPSDYEMLQLNVGGDGSWSFNGSFTVGKPFSQPIGGAAGSLYVAPEPRAPGDLKLWGGSANIQISPGRGTRTTAIGYSSKPGHGIPADVQPGNLVNDAVDDHLLIPASHKLITLTQDSSGHPGGDTFVLAPGYLDASRIGGKTVHETIQTETGALSTPVAGKGDMISVTSIVGGVKRTATATFQGHVRKPMLDVSAAGVVTLKTAGGAGRAVVRLATFASGGATKARPEKVSLHGRATIHRHTPKPKRHKRHKRHKRRHRS